jgi:GxxExxY protein
MLMKAPFHNQTRDIIAAAIEVHRVLGPGLLESAYSKCLQHELSAQQLVFVAQRRVPLVYKGVSLECDYRLDLLVEGVVVEVKALDTLAPIHQAQLLTYLRLAELPGGLVDQLQRRSARQGHQASNQPTRERDGGRSRSIGRQGRPAVM